MGDRKRLTRANSSTQHKRRSDKQFFLLVILIVLRNISRPCFDLFRSAFSFIECLSLRLGIFTLNHVSHVEAVYVMLPRQSRLVP